MESFIRDEVAFRQRIFFDGLEPIVGCRPTDLDCWEDIKGKGWIYAEVKHVKKSLTIGQRIALENVCNDHKSYSVAVILSHSFDRDKDIHISECFVEMIYSNRTKRWVSIDPMNPVKYASYRRKVFQKILDETY